LFGEPGFAELAALLFGRAAPDAGFLVGGQGELEAFVGDGAGGADPPGGFDLLQRGPGGPDGEEDVRALEPAIPTALLTARITDLHGTLELAHDHGHGALNPRAHLLAGRRADRLVGRASELGMGLYVWTVNDARQLRRLAAAGVTGLITDVPDRARRVLDG